MNGNKEDLTSYYWNRIFPEISPLSSTFHLALFSIQVGIRSLKYNIWY